MNSLKANLLTGKDFADIENYSADIENYSADIEKSFAEVFHFKGLNTLFKKRTYLSVFEWRVRSWRTARIKEGQAADG